MLEKFSGTLKQIKQSPDNFRQCECGDLSGVGAQRSSDSGGGGGGGSGAEAKPATALAQAH